MKVFIYYISNHVVLEELNDLGILGQNYPEEICCGEPYFYAYTKSKKVAKRFENTRNKDMFIRKIIDVDSSDYLEMVEYFKERRKKKKKSFRYQNTKSVILPVTLQEYWICVEYRRENIIDFLGKIPCVTLNIFSREVQRKLISINYDTEVLSSLDDHRPRDISSKFITKYGWRNEFMFLIILYGKLLNISNVLLEKVDDIDETTQS